METLPCQVTDGMKDGGNEIGIFCGRPQRNSFVKRNSAVASVTWVGSPYRKQPISYVSVICSLSLHILSSTLLTTSHLIQLSCHYARPPSALRLPWPARCGMWNCLQYTGVVHNMAQCSLFVCWFVYLYLRCDVCTYLVNQIKSHSN
jgi:hypothetical protein